MAFRQLNNRYLAILPLLPPSLLVIRLIGNPIPIVQGWLHHLSSDKLIERRQLYDAAQRQPFDVAPPPVGSQLLAYLTMAMMGYLASRRLVPHIKQYTLRKGISGKDLGKRGTSIADKDVYVSAHSAACQNRSSAMLAYLIHSLFLAHFDLLQSSILDTDRKRLALFQARSFSFALFSVWWDMQRRIPENYWMSIPPC